MSRTPIACAFALSILAAVQPALACAPASSQWKPARCIASVPADGGADRLRGIGAAYRAHILRAADATGVPAELLLAVISVESGGRARAVSPKGALGLMQLMPATARLLRVSDPFDPAQNIRGGARWLRGLLSEFRGDLRLALAAYNAGSGAVRSHGGIPPYRETQTYVRLVLETRDLARSLGGVRWRGEATQGWSPLPSAFARAPGPG